MPDLGKKLDYIYEQFIADDGAINVMRKTQRELVTCIKGNGTKGLAERVDELETSVDRMEKNNAITDLIKANPKLFAGIILGIMVIAKGGSIGIDKLLGIF